MLKNYAIFGFLSAYISYILACSCLQPTQQNTWCDADWISKAKIIQKIPDHPNMNIIIPNTNIQYVASHLKIFKGNKNLSQNIVTSFWSSACGVDYLEPGLTYLLSGYDGRDDSLEISLCLFMPVENGNFTGHPEWSTVHDELYQRLKNGNFSKCEEGKNNQL